MPQCCYLAKGAMRPSHTTNTIKFDRIPFDPGNSIKRFDLCPFDQKNSTYLQPPTGTALNWCSRQQCIHSGALSSSDCISSAVGFCSSCNSSDDVAVCGFGVSISPLVLRIPPYVESFCGIVGKVWLLHGSCGLLGIPYTLL